MAQAFLSLKKTLLTIAPLAKTSEMLKESAKNQAISLIVKLLAQKQKHFYKTVT